MSIEGEGHDGILGSDVSEVYGIRNQAHENAISAMSDGEFGLHFFSGKINNPQMSLLRRPYFSNKNPEYYLGDEEGALIWFNSLGADKIPQTVGRSLPSQETLRKWLERASGGTDYEKISVALGQERMYGFIEESLIVGAGRAIAIWLAGREVAIFERGKAVDIFKPESPMGASVIFIG